MEKPEPLVPAEVDLTDFKFMPLEVARLLQSEWWAMACMEDTRRCAAAINLWAMAWHQRPAASLPSNDAVLALWARVSLAVWQEIREAVMEPWVLCSDGRWYHPVVAEKANEAWAERMDYQRRKAEFSARQKARIGKRWSKEGDENTWPDTEENTGADTVRNTGRINKNIPMKGRGKGKGTGIDMRDKSLLSDAEAPDDVSAPDPEPSAPPDEGYSAEFEVWWGIYPRKDAKRTAFLAFKRAKKRTTVAKLMEGAAAYAKRRKGEDQSFTKQAATWLNSDGWNDQEQAQKRYPPGYVPMGWGG